MTGRGERGEREVESKEEREKEEEKVLSYQCMTITLMRDSRHSTSVEVFLSGAVTNKK